MDTNTRQLAHLVTQTFEKFEAAVLTCLPPDKRAEVVLSAPWCEFRAVVGRLTGQRPAPALCEGWAASWCPVCGTCTCGMQAREQGQYSPTCPLHSDDSQHGDAGFVGENDETAQTCTKGAKS